MPAAGGAQRSPGREGGGHALPRRTAARALAHLLPADAVSHDPVAAFHAAARAFGLRPEPKHRPDAPDRPAVLFIDDLHLLDNASAVLLGHLLWARAVFLIATVRDGAPPSDAVEAIDRSESTRRIAVRPFSRAQVRNVLRRCLGHPIEHAALDALVASSQGNALFLYELVSGAVDDGTLELGDGLWRLNGRPTGTRRLSAIIRQRLQACPARARNCSNWLRFASRSPSPRCARRAPGPAMWNGWRSRV